MPVVITGNNTPTAGGVTYGDGTTYANTAAGTSGQALLSNGASAPTWGTPAASTATTATNLAGGSNGTIPYQSAAGTTQMLAVGSSGQVLQTNGAGAPTWVTPGGGGSWVYLSTVTATAASTIDIEPTFDSTYDMYAIVGTGFFFAAGGASSIYIQLKVGGTYQTSSYGYASVELASQFNPGNQVNTGSATSIAGAVSGTSSGASLPGSFIYYVQKPELTNNYKAIWGNNSMQGGGGAQFAISTFTGSYVGSLGALTGVRLIPSNGSSTMTAKVRVYGIKNS